MHPKGPDTAKELSLRQVLRGNEEATDNVPADGGPITDLRNPAGHPPSGKGQGPTGNCTQPPVLAMEGGWKGETTSEVPSLGNRGNQQQRCPPAADSAARTSGKRKFDVKKAMQSLPMEMLARLQRGLTILNFNISGLRTDYKKNP